MGLLSTSASDWWCVFDPRPIFIPVMRDQSSNFREIGIFSTLQVHISNFYHSEVKPSPACSPLNFEQTDFLFRYLDQVILMHNILICNIVTLAGKFAGGQNGSMALIIIINDQGGLFGGKMEHILSLRTSRNPQGRRFSHCG